MQSSLAGIDHRLEACMLRSIIATKASRGKKCIAQLNIKKANCYQSTLFAYHDECVHSSASTAQIHAITISSVVSCTFRLSALTTRPPRAESTSRSTFALSELSRGHMHEEHSDYALIGAHSTQQTHLKCTAHAPLEIYGQTKAICTCVRTDRVCLW